MSRKATDIIEKITNQIRDRPFPQGNLFVCKERAALVGTVGSGKSTFAASLGITTQTLMSIRKEFFCRIVERNSNILGDMSNLRSGRFPNKTASLQTFAAEAGYVLGKKNFLGTKQMQMPVCDIAGEDLQMMIRQYGSEIGSLGAVAYSASQNLTRYVKECNIQVICADASRAVLGHEGQQIKQETDKALHFDPDVNLVRILNDVFDYRDQIHKPLKGIALVVTKWDELKPHVEHLGLDLFNPTENDMATFMDTFYPSVSQAIKSYLWDNKNTKVAYFPFYVEVERNEDGTEKKRNDGSLIVKAKQSQQLSDVRKPSYAEQSTANAIDWLLEFAS
jgi:hypothetical protein